MDRVQTGVMFWKRTGKIVLFFSLLIQMIFNFSWAIDSGIPIKPSAPPPLPTRTSTDFFQCQRFFVHQGQRIACDSNVRLDGENLRQTIQDVPQALAELDLYQKNRAKTGKAAYIGTLGLFLAVAGSLISLHYLDSAGNSTQTSDIIRNTSMIGGGGIMVGSFISTLSFIKRNEIHIGKAVNFYNQAHPENPIELQFNTGIHF